jgi:hypothetical protein
MTALKDIPGGPEFVERCAKAAADLSLAFAGHPDEKVHQTLETTRSNLRSGLSVHFGPETAELFAQCFVRAVLDRKKEIESAGHISQDRLV